MFPLLVATAAALDLRVAADGNLVVVDDNFARTYDASGHVLAVADAPEPVRPPKDVIAVAQGGGNAAVLRATELVVTGHRACTVPVFGPGTVHDRSVDEDGWRRVPNASSPYALAIGERYAVLSEDQGALVVDLRTCAPVEARDVGKVGAVAITGATLRTVRRAPAARGFEIESRSLPDLRFLGRVSTATAAAAYRTATAVGAPAGGPSADRSYGASASGEWQVRRRPQGMIVVGHGKQWGVPMPEVAGVVVVSPDGRVVVSRDRRRLSATRVADGVRLWSVDACDEDPIEAGPDWLAVRCGTRQQFRDPADGRLVAPLDHAGTLEIDGHLVPFDLDRARGAAWRGLPAEPSALRPRGVRLDDKVDRFLCTDARAGLAGITAFPVLYNAALADVEARCAVGAPPTWPTASVPMAGASWVWTAPEPIQDLTPLDGGRLLVEGKERVGVLGADGLLLWVTTADVAMGVGNRVVLWREGEIWGVDAETGRQLWSRPGKLLGSGGLPALDTEDGTARIDVDTGAVGEPSRRWATSWGYSCSKGTCDTRETTRVLASRSGATLVTAVGGRIWVGQTEVPWPADYRLVEFVSPDGFLARARGKDWALLGMDGKVRETFSAVDEVRAQGGARWVRSGSTVRAMGVSPPAVAQVASLEAVPAVEPLPPRLPEDGHAPLARLPTATLTDTPSGVELRVDGKVVWTVHDRRAVGVVGEVALVEADDGTIEARGLRSRSVLWRQPLRGASTASGGLTANGGRDLIDAATGRLLTTLSSPIHRVLVSGDRAIVAVRTDGLTALSQLGVGPVGTVDGNVLDLAVVGDVVVVVHAFGEVTALRDGRVLWHASLPTWRHLAAANGRLVVWEWQHQFVVDAETGAVLDAFPLAAEADDVN